MKLIGRRSNAGINTIEVILLSGFIALFAMAALPRFSDSRLFSDIARAKRDIASIALAMEAYRIDNAGYPASMLASPLPGKPYRDELDQQLLTTPVCYMDQVLNDVFNPLMQPLPGYRVYAVSYVSFPTPPYYRRSYSVYPKTSWMSWSSGPDRLSNTAGYYPLPRILQNEAETNYGGPAIGVDRYGRYIGGTATASGMRYDPTNGEMSYGDLYHFGSEALIRLN
ncbi:hypothetical protein LLG95_13475 [bacterium]|nr:hypothetical protein [bacterium]